MYTRGLVSFHIWKVFSESLHRPYDSIDMYRFRDRIFEPKSKLPIYTGPLESDSFKFLTNLRITSYFSVPEIVQLHKLRNLVALDIIGDGDLSEPSVTDRSIRAWSSAAQSEGAFPVLRVLKLSSHPQVTDTSLTYLDAFPSLDIYEVEGCGFKWKKSMKVRLRGWHATKDPALPLLEAECTERAISMRSKFGWSPRKTPTWSKRYTSEGSLVTLLPRAQVPKFISHEHTVRTEFIDIVFENLEYKEICRIGELRNDGDFEKAGIDIGDQPIFDGELISPLPIVNFRLGRLKPSTLKRDRAKRLLFIRIKDDDEEVDEQENSVLGSLKRSSSTTNQLPPAKRKLQRKKKDLGDVLGSFMP